MLKLETKNCETRGIIKGSLNELASDVIITIRYVWNMIKETDEESANLFKYYIERSLDDGVMFCGDDEIPSVVGKAIERMVGKAIERMAGKKDADDELLDILEQLKSALEELEGSD